MQLDKNQLIDIVNKMKGVTKVEVEKGDHLDDFTMQNSGLKCWNEDAWSQYIGLINPGIHLSTVYNKLKDGEEHEDPITRHHYDGKQIAHDLFRWCELNRTKPIIAIRDPIESLVYGFVSPEHVIIYDKDIYNMSEAFLENIPHNSEYYHDINRMMLRYEFPEISFKLQHDNAMNFQISVGNCQFGRGSLFIKAGSYEQRCTNSPMAWQGVFTWMMAHRWRNAEEMLTQFSGGLTEIFSSAQGYMKILQRANEIIQPIIKENESVIRVLRSQRFNLLKREAEGVWQRIRANPEYQKLNGFNLGRAISEEARDTDNLTRKIELEQISGRTMVSQVKL